MPLLKKMVLFTFVLFTWANPLLAGKKATPLPHGLSKDTQFIIYYIDKRIDAIDKRIDDIDKRMDALDKRMDALDRRVDALQAHVDKQADSLRGYIDKRIEDLREDMNARFEQVDKRFEQMTKFLWILTTVFSGLVVAVIAFALWDRRTMLKEAKRQIESEGSLKDLILALRKLAEKDKALAEVLRSFSLM